MRKLACLLVDHGRFGEAHNGSFASSHITQETNRDESFQEVAMAPEVLGGERHGVNYQVELMAEEQANRQKRARVH